jgi:vitamin B12 transporter
MGPHRPPSRRRFPLRPSSTIARTIATLALGLLACSSGGASAAEAPPDSTTEVRYKLPPVVVTAERSPLPLDKVPLEVTVIDRDRLDAQKPLLLSEILRQVPAVDVQRSGTLGKLTDVRLRGADPRHTLVLFDGVPLNGPWLGTYDFADAGDAGIEQIEVLGGPASSLYGSAAVGGVIQLLPRVEGAGTASRTRASFEYGEDATVRAGAEWVGALGRSPAGISFTRLSSDGEGPRDEYLGWSGTARTEVPVSTNDRLRVSAMGTDGDKELPYDFVFNPGAQQIHDPNIEEKDRLAAGSATWRHLLGSAVYLEGEGSLLYGNIHYKNGENQPGGDQQDTHLKNTRDMASLRLGVSPGAGARLIAGGEYRGDQVDRTDEAVFFGFPSKTRVDRGIHSRSLFADGHLEWRSRVLLDLGIRVEDHSVYGANGLPRVGAAVLLGSTGVRLRGGYGRAFTAPTLSDLYYPGYSDSTLNPERSTTWEAGADGHWMGGRLTAQATYHHTEFKDLIQSNSFFAPDNIGSARIEGEEYAIGVVPRAGVRIRAAAAHLIAKKLTESDPDPDRRLAKRPEWRFTASGEIQPHSGWTLTGAWRWVDPVRDPFDFEDVNGRMLVGDNPGYAALDLGASASLKRWAPLEVHARLSNALDRDYSEVKGFPARGRAFALGLTASL